MARTDVARMVIKQSLIPLNSLLLFFLLFETKIMLPQWLQVFGRMHPLMLHFPIVLIIIYAMLLLFFPARIRREPWYETSTNALLLAAAFTASITALMGFALSGGEDYDPEALSLHKWTGVIIPFALHLLYALRRTIYSNFNVARAFSLVLVVIISLAGHHGAVITHGENFILAPLAPVNERIVPAFEDAFVYADMVEPVLENKCFSCHNTKKSKGDLIMDTRELFIKGGKEGVPWDTTKEDLGILMRRLHLPLEDKKHMPPKGKPQLTDDEIFVLHEWIKRGSNFEIRFVDLPQTDTLYAIGKNKLKSGAEENYDFPHADESQITSLNNNYRLVVPVATGSPALSATFYNKSQFKISLVEELAPAAQNIVELNLAGMPVKDEDVARFKQFRNLRRLNLNFSEVTGKTMGQLKELPELKMISLSGAPVEYAELRNLSDFPKLRSVYIWSTPAAGEKIEELEKRNKNITWFAGYTGDTVVLQLTPPMIQNEEEMIEGPVDLRVKHFINGVDIRYTLDGNDPDSIRSPKYQPGIRIDSNLTVKVKAFKQGWISSEVAIYHFYKKRYVPDSVQLLTTPGKDYRGNLHLTLNDNVRSDVDQRSGKWVGFEKNRFEALLRFDKPVKMTSITLGTLEDTRAWIFPPEYVQVWGGDNANNLRLIKTCIPEQPGDYRKAWASPVVCAVPGTEVKFIKLVAKPAILPKWHADKGKQGHLFVDEIFVN